MKKVKLNGSKYLLIEDTLRDEGRLLNVRTKKVIAFIYSDGEIKSYGKVIGHRKDLEYV